MPQRAWLKAHGVDFGDYEEEKTYQVLVKKYKIFEVIRAKKLEFAMNYAANKLTE
jgi:hypothetical protein